MGRLIEAVDGERLAIAGALGVTIHSDPALGVRQGYMREENYSTGYSRAPGFLGIKAQSRLDHRYLTEDVGYGLVFMTDLAARLGVPTPVMDSVIAIASVVLARDFRAEGERTLGTLGLDGALRRPGRTRLDERPSGAFERAIVGHASRPPWTIGAASAVRASRSSAMA